MKCTEIVMQDHAILRRALDILDTLVSKMEHGERIEIADTITLLKFIRLFGVEYHQTMEEQVLLPTLLSVAPQESPMRHIPYEHTEHRSLLALIESALSSRKGLDFVRNSRGLVVLLRNHFDREEGTLRAFDAMCLSKEEDDALAAEITRNRKPPESYTSFSILEWKYIPKARVTPLGSTHKPARAHGSANTV